MSTPPTIEISQKTPLLGAYGGVLGAYSRLYFSYRSLIECLQIFLIVNSCLQRGVLRGVLENEYAPNLSKFCKKRHFGGVFNLYVMKISKFLKKKNFIIYIRGEAEYAPRAFFTFRRTTDTP